MACPGGCIGGGGQPYGISDSVRRQRIEGLYQDDKDSAVRCSHENPEIKRVYAEFLGKPLGEKSERLLHTKYKARKVYRK
jgi:NADH-quinone oxidoreductase subunit G